MQPKGCVKHLRAALLRKACSIPRKAFLPGLWLEPVSPPPQLDECRGDGGHAQHTWLGSLGGLVNLGKQAAGGRGSALEVVAACSTTAALLPRQWSGLCVCVGGGGGLCAAGVLQLRLADGADGSRMLSQRWGAESAAGRKQQQSAARRHAQPACRRLRGPSARSQALAACGVAGPGSQRPGGHLQATCSTQPRHRGSYTHPCSPSCIARAALPSSVPHTAPPDGVGCRTSWFASASAGVPRGQRTQVPAGEFQLISWSADQLQRGSLGPAPLTPHALPRLCAAGTQVRTQAPPSSGRSTL